jgi:hypothetical protein
MIFRMRILRTMEVARNCAGLHPGLPRLREYSSLLFATGRLHWRIGMSWHALQGLTLGSLPAIFMLSWGHDEVYTMLWALVFGFATLNILSLGARSFDGTKSGLNFGEIIAIMVVLVSVTLLAGELLYFFGILPIRLEAH